MANIEAEYISAPMRIPRYHPFFSVRDADGNQVRFLTHAFRTAYAAHYWLDTILTACADSCTQSWKDEYTLVLTHADSGHTLSIREHRLKDVMKYRPTKEEAKWTPLYPDTKTLEKLSRFWHNPTPKPAPTPKLAPTPKPTPTRHKKQKPAPEGYITVAQIANELNIQPNKARNILRKAKIQKPKDGWMFKSNDSTLTTIRELLSKGS